jgi:hypothetical protein
MTRNSSETAHLHLFCNTLTSTSDQVLRYCPSTSLNELMKCGDALRKGDRLVQDGSTTPQRKATNRCERMMDIYDILDEALVITSDYETIIEMLPTDASMLGQ